MAGRKWLVILLGVVNVFAMAGILFWYVSRDNTPPVITYEDTIIYEETMSDEELLQGAVAVDETDGDVSDTLVVEKVTVNYNTGTAVVTCGAMDDSGNVVKESFQVQMRTGAVSSATSAGNASGDVFTLEAGEAVIDAENAEEEVAAEMTEEAVTEEETTEEETSEEETTEEETTEEAEEEQEAPAPRANTVQNEEPQVDPAEIPVLYFGAVEVKTKKGYNPAWVTVISQLQDNKDSYEYLLGKLIIHGEYTNAEVGSYDVRVSTVDSDGHESAPQAIRIIVEE